MPLSLRLAALALLLVGPAAAPARSQPSALSRADAVRIALQQNPRIAAAQAAWDNARADRLVALSPENPELELEYEELSGVFDTGSYGERRISIAQRIPSPLRWWFNQRASSHAASYVRTAVFEQTRLDVVVETEQAFDRVLADRQIAAVAEENLGLARDLASKAHTRFEAGDVARLEVLRADVEVGLAESRLADASRHLTASRAALEVLLGWAGKGPLRVAGDLDAASGPEDLETLKRRALDRRSDLAGARSKLNAARAERSAAIAGLVPDLTIGVARQSVGPPGGRTSYWAASFGIELPVWAPFRQRGQLSKTGARERKAEAELNQLEQRATAEVAAGYAALEAAGKKLAVYEAGVLNLAETAHQTAVESYRQGKVTYLEVLESRRTLADARIAHIEALYDHRHALAELERATGGTLP